MPVRGSGRRGKGRSNKPLHQRSLRYAVQFVDTRRVVIRFDPSNTPSGSKLEGVRRGFREGLTDPEEVIASIELNTADRSLIITFRSSFDEDRVHDLIRNVLASSFGGKITLVRGFAPPRSRRP